MARVTVEDCIDKVENRFDLVLLASHRARMISSGSQITLDRDNDKNPVVSLREIADETIDIDALRQGVIQGLQRRVEKDEPEDEDPDLLSLGQGLGALKPEEASQRRSLIDEEIADEVLTVGEDAIEEGADIADDAESTEAESAEAESNDAADDAGEREE